MVDKSELIPVRGIVEKIAVERATALGSKLVELFVHDEFKIMKSIDPSGPKGEFELHVSVSHIERLRVSHDVALGYALGFSPRAKWQRCEDGSDIAVHFYTPLSDTGA